MDRRQTPLPQIPFEPAALERSIEERKRLLYLIASLIALPSIYFVWRYYGGNPFNRIVYPLLLAEAVIWSSALIWRWIPLLWIERLVLYSIALFYLAKFAYHFFFLDPAFVWKEIETIAAGIMILFILAYIMLPHRLALRLSILYCALIFGLAMTAIFPERMELLRDVIRIETRLMVVAILTFILAKLKDDLILSQKQAAYWEWQANVDHLTQLPNRRMISEIVTQYLRQKKAFFVLLIDLDDFKCFNDTYGHDVGDVLLSRIAFTLKTNLRATDLAARWGGEEFLVVVSEASAEQAAQLAERLRHEVFSLDFNGDRISISIGGTLCQAQDDLAALLKRADNALYTAKAQGRNCICWE